MKRWLLVIGLLAYFASGLFIVRGNEQVLVRRFGKARLPLVASGLRFDLPWPFVRLDRVNLNEVRTVQDMALPGYGLHPLKGKLAGFWSVSVSVNWRIVFRFEDGSQFLCDQVGKVLVLFRSRRATNSVRRFHDMRLAGTVLADDHIQPSGELHLQLVKCSEVFKHYFLQHN